MKGSTLSRALFAVAFLSTASQPQPLRASPLSPPSGSYELIGRLELPHLERWGVDKTTIPYQKIQDYSGVAFRARAIATARSASNELSRATANNLHRRSPAPLPFAVPAAQIPLDRELGGAICVIPR
jgi:hypothetical protein